MSAGTPVLVAKGTQVHGSATLAIVIGTGVAGTPSVSAGSAVAVWIADNASSNNISGPCTDTQTNTYTSPAAVNGTGGQGKWFVALNAAALANGADTINITFSGTGGDRTFHVFACSGVALASALDLAPTGTTGTSTSPSQTVGTPAQSGEVALMGMMNANAGGTPAVTGSWSGAAIIDTQHQGSATYGTVAAFVTGAPAALTASATITSAVWGVSAITLEAAPVTVSHTGLVGCTTPIQAFNQAGCYDNALGITTQQGADNNFVSLVNRSLPNGKISKVKKFWNEGAYETSGVRGNDLAAYFSFGTKVMLALFPPHVGYTAADVTALNNFLTFVKGLGFNASNCEVCLWQEPEIGNKFGAAGNPAPLGTAGFQAAMAFFGPTVVASGLPMVLDIGMGQGVPGVLSYINAGLAAAGCVYTAIYCDFYFGAYSASGIAAAGRLSQPASLADANLLPFGLGEFGCHLADDFTSYFNYITGFFQARLAAGKQNADLGWYQGQCNAGGTGDLTQPILTSTDPRIHLYQQMFDTLTSPVVSNTITVTNPGNQTATAGVAIAPLTITATDSDPTQTLTFSATGLPPGLVISAAGVITGTPSSQGTNAVTVTATDGTGASGKAGFTWTVSPIVTNTITVTNPGTQNTQLGAVVTLTLSATDSNPADGPPFTWAAGGLPPGLVLNTASGIITGSPTLIGVYSVSVSAVDSIGSSGPANFTWNVTNPNVLPHGAFTTINPVNPSPIAGLGVANELSYEIALGLTAGSGSTIPFCAVVVQFYDFDELPSLQTPVDVVAYRVPMGTNGDPNGAAVTFGSGPQRGAFMRVQLHNVDTVDATLTFAQVVGTARTRDRHDWRWDCGGNAPVIPGYVNATAAQASLVLGGVQGFSVPAGQTKSVLCSMYGGQAFVRCSLNTGGPASIVLSVVPQPPGLFSSQALFNVTVVAGAANDFFATVALPRGPCVLQFNNNGGAQPAVVNAELIAIET